MRSCARDVHRRVHLFVHLVVELRVWIWKTLISKGLLGHWLRR